ncbi:MAG TPA: hypothetical protein VNK67_14860 [Burkholderiales bacterium]|nr:hypothetical protein [Burkholderiales bacterium]
MLAAAALALAGCEDLPFGYTPIGEINAAPARFEGSEVKLKGRVAGIVKLPGVRAYTLQDESGRITVVAAGELPPQNSEVALRGTVRSALIVGGAAVGLRVEERRRLR